MTIYVHGRATCCEKFECAHVLRPEIETTWKFFGSNRIDKGASQTPVISIAQYREYCKSFDLSSAMKPFIDRIIMGIGEAGNLIGRVVIQVPFKNPGVVIDVSFLIIRESVPAILPMKDILNKDSEISIQREYVSLENLHNLLTIKSYILIHEWNPSNLLYVFYTKNEVWTLPRSFGHPSVKALGTLLRLVEGHKLTKEAAEPLEKTEEECDV